MNLSDKLNELKNKYSIKGNDFIRCCQSHESNKKVIRALLDELVDLDQQIQQTQKELGNES